MAQPRQLLFPALLILAAIGCSNGVTEPDEHRLELRRLETPATLTFGQPLVVGIHYSIGACIELSAVSGQLVGGTRLEIEVLGKHMSLPAGMACLGIVMHRDTTFTFISPPVGQLTVVGLQPWGPPLESSVVVSPAGS